MTRTAADLPSAAPAPVPGRRAQEPRPGPGGDTGRVAGAGRAPGAGHDVTTTVVRGVLGAGMLVVPPVVLALATGAGLLVWAAHLVLGATACLLLARLVARGRWAPAPVSLVLGAALGRRARLVVDGCFAVAFAGGQAAIAWFVVTALPGAAGPGAGPDGRWLAVGVLVVAGAVAVSALRVPDAVLRARRLVAGGLAVACGVCGWPGDAAAFVPAGITTTAAVWLAFAATLFAGVGWESVTEARPDDAAGRRATSAVLRAAAVVAAVYLGLAVLTRWAPASAAAADAPLVRRALGVAVGVVLASYVVTNLRAAAGIAARLRGPHDGPAASYDGPADPHARPAPRGLVVAVAVLACALVVAVDHPGAVPLLLLGPAAAVVVTDALAAVAAVRHARPRPHP